MDQPEYSSEDLELTLDRLDEAHNYTHWIAELIRPHLKGNVLEVGAGIGSVSALIRSAATTLTICEPHHGSFTALKQRFGEDPCVSVLALPVDALAEQTDLVNTFDAVVLVNVLEHIADDAVAVHSLHQMLRPGGELIIYVPAFNALMSPFDRRIGHHRRYRRGVMRALFPSNSWDLHTLHYVNAPGFVLWWLGMRILKMSPATSRATGIFDRYCVPAIRAIETRIAPPVGQSLFAVARKV
jgi:SAM-dependent methyltransferase